MSKGSRKGLKKWLSVSWLILGKFDFMEIIYNKSLNMTNTGQRSNRDDVSILQKNNHGVIVSGYDITNQVLSRESNLFVTMFD